MARLFTDSFDHYDSSRLLDKWSNQIGYSQSIISGVAGATNNCLRVPGNSRIYKNLATSYSTLTFGSRFRVDNLQTFNEVVEFFDSGIVQTVIAVDVAGGIQAWLGPGSYGIGGFDGSTLIGQSSAKNLVSSLNWCYIEVQVVFATGSTGSVSVRVNGQTVIAATNVKTAYTSNASANQIALTSTNGLPTAYFDDLYVNDNSGSVNNGFDGDQRIVCLYPAGVGSSTGWSANGAASNWQCVSENPPDDDTTYASASAAGLVDLYTTTSLPNASEIGAIAAVQMVLDCKTDDGGSATISPCFGNGGTPSVGPATAINSSYNMALENFGQNPLTSANWAVSDMSTLQIGAKRVS
jgi:hypothetical protein